MALEPDETLDRTYRLADRILSTPTVIDVLVPTLMDIAAIGSATGDAKAAAHLRFTKPEDIERIAAAIHDRGSDATRDARAAATAKVQKWGARMLAGQVVLACSWLGVDPDDLDAPTLAVVLAARGWALD